MLQGIWNRLHRLKIGLASPLILTLAKTPACRSIFRFSTTLYFLSCKNTSLICNAYLTISVKSHWIYDGLLIFYIYLTAGTISRHQVVLKVNITCFQFLALLITCCMLFLCPQKIKLQVVFMLSFLCVCIVHCFISLLTIRLKNDHCTFCHSIHFGFITA
mgnify:CR=1 FL=1